MASEQPIEGIAIARLDPLDQEVVDSSDDRSPSRFLRS